MPVIGSAVVLRNVYIPCITDEPNWEGTPRWGACCSAGALTFLRYRPQAIMNSCRLRQYDRKLLYQDTPLTTPSRLQD